MATTELLDLQGIDALLERFKERRTEQQDLRASTTDFEADHPSILRPSGWSAISVRSCVHSCAAA